MLPWDILQRIFEHCYRLSEQNLQLREHEVMDCVPFCIVTQRRSIKWRSEQMFTLLELFYDTKAADPRDKVYVLSRLAINRGIYHATVPHHEKQTSELFCDVMQFHQNLRHERKLLLAEILRGSLQVTIDEVVRPMAARGAHLWPSFVPEAHLLSVLQTTTPGFKAVSCDGTWLGFVEKDQITISLCSAFIFDIESDNLSPYPDTSNHIRATRTTSLSTSLYQGLSCIGIACDSIRRGDSIYPIEGLTAAVVVRQKDDNFVAVGGALLDGNQDRAMSQSLPRISFLLEPGFYFVSGFRGAGP